LSENYLNIQRAYFLKISSYCKCFYCVLIYHYFVFYYAVRFTGSWCESSISVISRKQSASKL